MDNYLKNSTVELILKKLNTELEKNGLSGSDKYKKLVKKYMVTIKEKFQNKSVSLDELINLTVLKIRTDILKKHNSSFDNLFNQHTQEPEFNLNDVNIEDEVNKLSKDRNYNVDNDNTKKKPITIKYLSNTESIQKIIDYANKQEVTNDTFLKLIKQIYRDGYYLDITDESKINLKNYILGFKNKNKSYMVKSLEKWL